MKKILIADDEAKIIRILALQLAAEGYEVLTAENGTEAVKLALKEDIALAVLDIMMPEMNGIDAMKEIKSQKGELPVILLTARDDTEDIVTGLDEGADEYITKPFVFEELAARLRARLRSSNKSESAAKAAGVVSHSCISLNTDNYEATINGEAAALSKTEFDLLAYLLQNSGKVVSRDELLQNVWGYSYGGSNIVDVYVNYLREKIAKHTDQKIIETVRGRGYIVQ